MRGLGIASCYTLIDMPNGTHKPKSQTLGLLIALSILIMVGFFVLYFKIDLDDSLAATDAALLSQQIRGLEMRIPKMEGTIAKQKAVTLEPAAPTSTVK